MSCSKQYIILLILYSIYPLRGYGLTSTVFITLTELIKIKNHNNIIILSRRDDNTRQRKPAASCSRIFRTSRNIITIFARDAQKTYLTVGLAHVARPSHLDERPPLAAVVRF